MQEQQVDKKESIFDNIYQYYYDKKRNQMNHKCKNNRKILPFSQVWVNEAENKRKKTKIFFQLSLLVKTKDFKVNFFNIVANPFMIRSLSRT